MTSLLINAVQIRNLRTTNAPYSSSTTPVLNWTPIEEAVQYTLKMSNTWTGMALAGEHIVSTNSYTSTSIKNDDTMLYWQVKPIATNGSEGAWSEIFHLHVNWGAIQNQVPSNNSSISDSSPTLSWDAVTVAESYEVQIADSKTSLDNATILKTASNSYTVPNVKTVLCRTCLD